MTGFFKTALLATALMTPLMLTTPSLRAADQKYHDNARNDDHEWNSHEDKAYRIWVKENHRKYVGFDKLKDEDRQSYWGWRHNHDDALLKITIK